MTGQTIRTISELSFFFFTFVRKEENSPLPVAELDHLGQSVIYEAQVTSLIVLRVMPKNVNIYFSIKKLSV